MLTIDRGTDGVLHLFAHGQLTTQDYANFVPGCSRLAADRRPKQGYD